MSLIQLIYVSDLVDATSEGDMSHHLLASILKQSAEHNTRDRITGMLLFSSGNFMQLLEGEPESVARLFERIQADPRHRNLIVVMNEPVTERQFAGWRMGWRHITPADALRLPELAPWFEFGFNRDAIRAQPGMALDLLRNFSQTMR